MRISSLLGLSVTLLLALAGCALFEEGSPNVCPQTAILDGPGELVRFAPGSAGNPGDVLFRTKMKSISGLCDVDEKKGVDMELQIAMEAARGAVAGESELMERHLVVFGVVDRERADSAQPAADLAGIDDQHFAHPPLVALVGMAVDDEVELLPAATSTTPRGSCMTSVRRSARRVSHHCASSRAPISAKARWIWRTSPSLFPVIPCSGASSPASSRTANGEQ